VLGGHGETRGAVPVVGIVLLVAVVVVLATVVTVPLLGVAEESADRQPAVAFETEQENESLTLTPVATESVDIERVQIRNETTTVPAEAYVEEDVERLSAGVAIRIDDNLLNSESLQVVYEGEHDSHLLRTVDASGVQPGGGANRFALPAYGSEQYERLTSRDLAAGDPTTGEHDSVFGIELTATEGGQPIDDNRSVEVTVTNHLGTEPFDDAPNNALPGSTTVTFEDGTGAFTIGGANRSDADLTLGFLGFLPEVNDVETIQLSVDNGTIADRMIDLTATPDG
jgi:FlaG/FlaF family flagellin (archaellin)